MNVLVLPSWYPTTSNPYNGDFVKHQSGLLHRWGIDISIMYADLDIRNFMYGNILPQINQIIDNNDISTTILRGPFYPKNTGLGTRLWINQFFTFVDRSISSKIKPDVIHAHTYLAAAVAAKIKSKHNIPFVVTEHYTGFVNGALRSSHLEIATYAFRNANQVFAVSKCLSKSITQKTNVATMVLPNFIDTELFQPHIKDNDTYRLIYVGDLIQRKQVNILLSAYRQVIYAAKYVTLQIIGDGPEKTNLKKQAAKLGIANQVQFLGKQSQQAVANMISQAHCMILPSKVETFGLVLIEALSCGVPIISFENGGSDKVFDSRHGILVNGHTPDALASAILDVKNHHSVYDPIVLRQHVMDNYSVDVIGPKLSSFYSQLIS